MLKVEDICTRFPRGAISWLMAIEGPVLKRVANHRIGCFMVRHFTHGGLARMGVRLALSGRLLEGRNPIEVSIFVLRYFFQPFLEEVRVTATEAVFLLTRCPYGWRSREDSKLCDAVMQMERELVAGIGASLVIEETIPEGAPMCRFTLRATA